MHTESARPSRFTFLLLALAAVAWLSPLAQAADRPPNFIIIFCDDLGYADLGCFGADKIKTPRLDKMAAEGMRMTSFYACAPVCTPSRAALLTGCYPQRVSLPAVLFPRSKTGISDKETTVAEVLQTKGYTTACIGKWHLGHLPPFLPTKHGFDSYFGIPYSNDMKPTPLLRNEETIEEPAKQETLTERYTEEAIKFITANKDKPFFLYLPHTFPHVPLHVSDRFKGKSARGLYGDVVECIDWSTGEILDALKKLGLDEQTLVVFTSDNGPWNQVGADKSGSALPLRGCKATTWEGGMREPTVVRWPGKIPAGKACNELAATIDLLPTIAKLAGADVPSDRIIDGKDIWPLLSGVQGAKTPHEAFFYYSGYNLQAVRSGRWKLILERGGGKAAAKKDKDGDDKKKAAAKQAEELYDLEADISESKDVAAQNPDVVKRLRELAEKCREDLGDSSKGAKGKNVRPCGQVGDGADEKK